MTDLLDFKCPSCGGGMEFDTGSQMTVCPYCDTEMDPRAMEEMDQVLEETAQTEDSFDWDLNQDNTWEGDEAQDFAVMTCQSCGGEIVGDKTMSAASCPYCDNPVVIAGNIGGDLRPQYIIPFKTTKEEAKEALKGHYKGKILLPKAFKDSNRIDQIQGVYVPFWLFDSQARGSFNYRATRTRAWSTSNYDYLETSHYLVRRAGSLAFTDVPVDGSSKMPDDLMESIEPYKKGDIQDFNPGFLAGFLADRYDLDAGACIERANTRVKRSVEEVLASTVQGYDTLETIDGTVSVTEGSGSYVLYPVWLLSTIYEGQPYTFAMNGQTGLFIGDLPMDKKAYVRWFIIIGLIAALVIYGLAWLIMR